MATKQAAAVPTSNRPLSRRVLAVIKRDVTTSTPRACWEHELPILEQIHGEGNVTLVDSDTLDEGYSAKINPQLLPFNKRQDQISKPSDSASLGFVFFGDPRMEYDRLAEAYGKLNEENVLAVEKIYGRFQDGRFAAVVGRATLDDMPVSQLREHIIGHGYIPATGQDSTDDERREAAKKRADLFQMDRVALVKLAEEVAAETV